MNFIKLKNGALINLNHVSEIYKLDDQKLSSNHVIRYYFVHFSPDNEQDYIDEGLASKEEMEARYLEICKIVGI